MRADADTSHCPLVSKSAVDTAQTPLPMRVRGQSPDFAQESTGLFVAGHPWTLDLICVRRVPRGLSRVWTPGSILARNSVFAGSRERGRAME